MPTITLQVGQCGNQLGTTFWDLMQQQHSHSSSSLLGQEWFASTPQQTTADPTATAAQINKADHIVQPRCVCIDSEAKVVKHWQGQQQDRGQHTVHMLGKGGGCGNNW
jgi:tubulin gamma